MTKKLTKTIGLSLLILGSVFASGALLSTAVQAEEEEKDAPVAIPETSAAIWQSIDDEANEISKLIQAGTLKDLHHHAFAIRDLVAALPAHSTSLPEDKMMKVKSDGKFVATLADRLDAAGDGNDKAAAESNFGKLKDILKSIQMNYSDVNPK